MKLLNQEAPELVPSELLKTSGNKKTKEEVVDEESEELEHWFDIVYVGLYIWQYGRFYTWSGGSLADLSKLLVATISFSLFGCQSGPSFHSPSEEPSVAIKNNSHDQH